MRPICAGGGDRPLHPRGMENLAPAAAEAGAGRGSFRPHAQHHAEAAGGWLSGRLFV